VADAPGVYVKWFEEDADDAPAPRRVMAAWLVRDVPGPTGVASEPLAYLGQRPAVTAALREELAAIFPDVEVDWDAVQHMLEAGVGRTNVAALTDDELAVSLRRLVQERGLSLMDLALRLGHRQRQVLPEMLVLLEDMQTVARFERTAGSIYSYMLEKHLDYAFALYKVRLFLEGDDRTLDELIKAEPTGFDDTAWQERRAYWRSQLDAYRSSRMAP